jgi:hypothetical protein
MYSDHVGRVYLVEEDGTIEDASTEARGDSWPPRCKLHGEAGRAGASNPVLRVYIA